MSLHYQSKPALLNIPTRGQCFLKGYKVTIKVLYYFNQTYNRSYVYEATFSSQKSDNDNDNILFDYNV